jgi:hypothetical protein
MAVLVAHIRVEVPDEVAEKALQVQEEAEYPIYMFSQYVDLDAWTYHLEAPLRWEREEE